LAVEDVDGFPADSPEIAAEAEFFLEADVEAGVGGEARRVGRADELLLEIDYAVRKAGAVFEEIAELDAPDVRGGPAPSYDAIGSVPEDGAGLLRDVEDGAEGGIENFIGVGYGARVGAIDFHVFGKNMASGDGGGAIAVFPSVLQEKNAAGLRGLLIDVGEAARAIAGEELEIEERVVDEFLLPACAVHCESGLLQAVCGKNELADDRTRGNDCACGVVKGVELLLVEDLGNLREIQRNIVDAPA